MKIYISADIEGTAGITHWNETEKSLPDYARFAEYMTGEVSAACKGAIEAGADDVLVKDAHDSARNIDFSQLPEKVRLFRGWACEPQIMVAGLDSSYGGVIFTGYHSPAGTNFNPLSHTMNTNNNYVLINGELCSELMICCMTASYHKVPILLVSGDAGLCRWINGVNPNIETVETSEGVGNANISIHPTTARNLIYERVQSAMKKPRDIMTYPMPDRFTAEINYKRHYDARKGSFYPGSIQVNTTTIKFETADYMELLKFFFWVL